MSEPSLERALAHLNLDDDDDDDDNDDDTARDARIIDDQPSRAVRDDIVARAYHRANYRPCPSCGDYFVKTSARRDASQCERCDAHPTLARATVPRVLIMCPVCTAVLIKPAGTHALCMCARCLHILRIPSTKETHRGASPTGVMRDDDEDEGAAADDGSTRRPPGFEDPRAFADDTEALHVVACVCPTCAMTVQAPLNAPDGVCKCGSCGNLLRVPAVA